MADNGNMKLVCVVLRTHGANIYPDTKNLFEYVFNNFQKIPVADEKKPTEVKEFITASDESEDAGSAQTGGQLGSKRYISWAGMSTSRWKMAM